MKKICFIAQFPPPIHGLSKAVETLYNSKLKSEFEFEKVDITNNKKFFSNLFHIFLSKADLFYFTISQTKGGNFRDLIILKLLEIQNKKCIIHLHGGYYRYMIDNDLPKWQRKANYNAVKKLDGVIVLGNSLKYIFKDMIDDNKIYVVANCVDDAYLLSKEEINEKISNIDNKQTKDILYLSNFIKEKGYEYVLELANITKKEFDKTNIKKFHFHFAGKFYDKKYELDFFDYIKNNQLDDFITYHGIVSGKEKIELLKKSDIFILLTNYPKEGQPISILEAMGNGMAVVTTNHAGIPDIVDNINNGIIVDKNKIEIEQIYSKILKIDFKEIIKNNYDKAKEYQQHKYIKNIENIFKE